MTSSKEIQTLAAVDIEIQEWQTKLRAIEVEREKIHAKECDIRNELQRLEIRRHRLLDIEKGKTEAN